MITQKVDEQARLSCWGKELPGRRRFWESLALVGYFVALTYVLNSLGVRPDVARLGADMNYTFVAGQKTPQMLTEAARKYGTVCVLEKDGKVRPAESGWWEIGYTVLIQGLALLGVDVDYVVLARIQILVFLLNSLLFSLLFGLVIQKVFPYSFVLLTLLIIFRHHNESVIYYMVSHWMFVTSLPLLALSFMLLMVRLFLPLRLLSGLLLASAGILAGLLALVRESEAALFVASLLVFLCFWLRREKALTFKRLALTFLVLLIPYLATVPLVKRAIVLHRASRTGLEPKEYHGGMRHGPWHVLAMSLGRYPNPYGYYYSDYFGFNLAARLLEEEGLDPALDSAGVPVGTAEYHRVLRTWYWKQIWKHPGYYAKYLARGFLDYAMFLPYTFFLDRPSRCPIGAHIPVVRQDVAYSDWDFVWSGPKQPDGSVKMDRTALKNLKPRYFYLNWAQWSVFLFMFLVLCSGPLLYRKTTPDMKVLLVGILIVFSLQSFVRTIIPMHGWGCLVAFYAAVVVIGLGWAALLVERFPSGAAMGGLRRYGVLALLGILGLLVAAWVAGGGLTVADRSIYRRPHPGAKLLVEGFLNYNIVLYKGRYYGFPQGLLPDYADPNLSRYPGVVVAKTMAEVKQLIRAKVGPGGKAQGAP